MGKEELSNPNECGTQGRPNGDCPNREFEKNIPEMCEACISDPDIWNLNSEEMPIMYSLFRKGVPMDKAIAGDTMIRKIQHKLTT